MVALVLIFGCFGWQLTAEGAMAGRPKTCSGHGHFDIFYRAMRQNRIIIAIVAETTRASCSSQAAVVVLLLLLLLLLCSFLVILLEITERRNARE